MDPERSSKRKAVKDLFQSSKRLHHTSSHVTTGLSDIPTVKVPSRAESAWAAFTTVLSVVEKVSVVFPPLQSAIGGITALIKTFEVRFNM